LDRVKREHSDNLLNAPPQPPAHGRLAIRPNPLALSLTPLAPPILAITRPEERRRLSWCRACPARGEPNIGRTPPIVRLYIDVEFDNIADSGLLTRHRMAMLNVGKAVGAVVSYEAKAASGVVVFDFAPGHLTGFPF
jgi:hypothetical protein